MGKPFFGWTGSVLFIDLTRKETGVLRPDKSVYATCLGGKTLAARYLLPHCARDISDPELPVCVFAGPLVGTRTPGASRAVIVTRSPLTGTLCDATVGGGLGVRLKRAGWDGVVITGVAERPCGIIINGQDVRIVDTDLAGATTSTVFEQLYDDETSVAVVGPAAENGTLFASVVVDRFHAAARGGPGGVWGAKNLKYISVRGSDAVAVHAPAAVEEARADILRLTAASPVLMGAHGFSRNGTGALFDLVDSRCMMPTDNFQRTRMDDASKVNARAFRDQYEPVSYGCLDCPVQCKLLASDGRPVPEYDVMAHFTALLGNDSPEVVMQANAACADLGLDPVSAAGTLACLREMTGQDFDGDSLLSLLAEMAEGGSLGQGASVLAEAVGRPAAAMMIKGLELGGYDPRGGCGMALGAAVAGRGGCFGRSYAASHEILRKPVATDRFSFSGKARMVKIAEDVLAAADSLGVCRHLFLAAGLEEFTKAYRGATGVEATGQELLAAGERGCYMDRIMNTANGFTASDDDLPERFFVSPGTPGGDISIPPLDRDAFLQARANYYLVRGLDADGLPTADKAAELGLEVTE